MCIAYLSLGGNPRWPLFIAANRDEYHRREALPAAPWPEESRVIAGRALTAGGTWLGWASANRWGILTNFRDPGAHRDDRRSRGHLVSDFLLGTVTPEEYAWHIHEHADEYNGFNLIVGQGLQAWYVGNHSHSAPQALGPGRYALSNHALDTPWPKVERLREQLDRLMPADDELTLDSIYQALRDGSRPTDDALPRTGIPFEFKKLLSSIFIVSPDYGTRCSTIIAVDPEGKGVFSETSYNNKGEPVERHDWPLFDATLTTPA